MNQTIHMMSDAGKFFQNKLEYTCRQMRLTVVRFLEDDVGRYAAVLEDAKHRKYLFATKRYIFFRTDMWGIVSFTRSLVEIAANHGYTLLMLIEEKDDEIPKDYIYTFRPSDILENQHTFENDFNLQKMLNVDITMALNLEPTRRKEILDTRVLLKKGNKEDTYNMTITRYAK